MEGLWVECEILENEDYDFCIYTVDKSLVYRDDLPLPKPGEILLIWDSILPGIRSKMTNIPFSKKGILVYSSDKKLQQQQ